MKYAIKALNYLKGYYVLLVFENETEAKEALKEYLELIEDEEMDSDEYQWRLDECFNYIEDYIELCGFSCNYNRMSNEDIKNELEIIVVNECERVEIPA